MISRCIVLLFVTILLQPAESATILNWIWGKPADDSHLVVADGVPLVSIPYESMTEDEKFLQAAAKFTDIKISSPLESCQHKVVMKIRTSCGDMSEEELAKLSVNLLNCQSAVEGRKVFPCSEEMSLKQCTTDMDPDLWNAYHLMSNRARAVCYASRSTQFRALTELTVNKLMQTAHSQIKTLGSLKESQERLEDQTLQALSSLSAGNKVLLDQQKYLRDAQASAHNLVTTNLRDLNSEKALIRSGHAQLVGMTEDIKTKLEKASADLMNQAMARNENHNQVLEDLMEIQDQARLIWEKIESSTDRIVAQNAEAAARYEQTLEKLGKINETIHFIWNVTESMRTEVDEKLGWITEYIGDTSEQLNKVYRTVLHVVYLMAAMIVAAFLQAPFITRATILGIVPINLATFLKHGMEACLDFTSITTLIFLITGMHFVMTSVQYLFGAAKKSVDERDSCGETPPSTNGTANGRHAHRGSSTPESTVVKSRKKRLHVRIVATMEQMLRTIIRKLINCKDTTVLILQSATSWCRQNSTPVEELSCSYLPSKKSREDLVMNYGMDYPSMSDDSTDFENSHHQMETRRNRYLDTENLVDANDLRRRINARNSPGRSYRASESRSTTPSNMGAPRMLCGALTKSGSKCRLRATQGGFLCSKHRTGSSIMGD